MFVLENGFGEFFAGIHASGSLGRFTIRWQSPELIGAVTSFPDSVSAEDALDRLRQSYPVPCHVHTIQFTETPQ